MMAHDVSKAAKDGLKTTQEALKTQESPRELQDNLQEGPKLMDSRILTCVLASVRSRRRKKTSKTASRRPTKDSKRPQESPIWFHDCPRWVQQASKSAQGALRAFKGPKTPSDSARLPQEAPNKIRVTCEGLHRPLSAPDPIPRLPQIPLSIRPPISSCSSSSSSSSS